uniref:Uncharacterized protein n=1 Tax=Arion vulgaris TaxID=1028688 RepID=A0A0B7BDW2_9EUPU
MLKLSRKMFLSWLHLGEHQSPYQGYIQMNTKRDYHGYIQMNTKSSYQNSTLTRIQYLKHSPSKTSLRSHDRTKIKGYSKIMAYPGRSHQPQETTR